MSQGAAPSFGGSRRKISVWMLLDAVWMGFQNQMFQSSQGLTGLEM